MATITRDELRAKIEGGADFVLVEALPQDVCRQRHLPGAVNLSFEDEAEILPRPALLPDKDANIVVSRGSRFRPTLETVARVLAANGYARVRDDAAGKQDWIAAWLPTESG